MIAQTRTDFYKAILDNLYDGVYFVNGSKHITYWNNGAERITGYSSARVMGKSCSDGLLMHVNEAGTVLCQQGCPLSDTLAGGKVREVEVYLHHADGHRVPVLVRVAPLLNEEGKVVGGVETFSDNSKMFKVQHKVDELNKTVLQDVLTGIGNRRYIGAKMETCFIELRLNNQTAGVLFLDIDFFKKVNDKYGHETGDKVLKMVASTIQNNVRASDFVGRWGGEEFVIILPQLTAQQTQTVAHKLRALVEASQLAIEPGIIKVTISVGATLIRSEDDIEMVLKRADDLMYASKEAGRNRVTFAV